MQGAEEEADVKSSRHDMEMESCGWAWMRGREGVADEERCCFRTGFTTCPALLRMMDRPLRSRDADSERVRGGVRRR